MTRRAPRYDRGVSITSLAPSEDSINMEDALEEVGRAVGSAVGLSRASSTRESRRKMKLKNGLSTQVRGITSGPPKSVSLKGSSRE